MGSMVDLTVPISDIRPAPGVPPAQAFRVLKVRGEIIDRKAAIELNTARNQRHQATIMQCQHRLTEEGTTLPDWAVLDLQGRIDEALAQLRKNSQKIDLFQEEITILFLSLQQESNGRPVAGFFRKVKKWLSPMP